MNVLMKHVLARNVLTFSNMIHPVVLSTGKYFFQFKHVLALMLHMQLTAK